MHHGERDGVVQDDHRVIGHSFEHAVEREDLAPVGVFDARRLVVNGGNRRLQLVRAYRALRQRSLTSATPSAIACSVPERAVLLRQRDELAVRSGAREPARVGEQHEREQPGDLGVVGQAAGETSRVSRMASFARSLRWSSGAAARRVALVEDQVEDVEHGLQARSATPRRRALRTGRRTP